MHVEEILQDSKKLLGTLCECEGSLLVTRNFRCWLVPLGSPFNISGIEQTILIKHPGLAYRVIATRYSRAGGAASGLDHVWVRGTLIRSEIPEAQFMLGDIVSCRGIDCDCDDDEEYSIDLEKMFPTDADLQKVLNEINPKPEDREEFEQKLRFMNEAW